MTIATPQSKISDFFPNSIISRGKALHEDNHVLHLKVFEYEGGCYEIDAIVLGSREDAYDVLVSVSPNRIMSECSCPYEHNCKHAVAAYLAAASQLASPNKTNSIDDWLQNLTNLAPHQQQQETETHEIHYLVRINNIGVGFTLVEKHTVGQTGAHIFLPCKPRSYEPRLPATNGNDRYLIGLYENTAQYCSAEGYDFANLPANIASIVTQSLAQCERAFIGETRQPLVWQTTPMRLQFEWHKTAKDRFQYTAQDENQQPIDNWIPGHPPLYVRDNEVGPLLTNLPLNSQQAIQSMPPISAADIERVNAHLAYYDLVEQQSQPEDHSQDTSDTIIRPQGAILVTLIGVQTKAQGVLPAIKLEAHYGPRRYPLTNTRHNTNIYGKVDIFDEQGLYYAVQRDKELELQPQEFLKCLDFGCFDYQEGSGLVWVPNLVNPRDHIVHWHRSLRTLEDKISAQGWHLDIDDSYQTTQKTASFSGEISEAQTGWFDLAFTIEVDSLKLSSQELIAQWLEADSPDSLAIQCEDKSWAIVNMEQVNPIIEILFELYNGAPNSDVLRIPAFRAFELDEQTFDFDEAPTLRRMRKEFLGFSGIAPTPPSKHLKAELREYQQKGLDWLNFLFRYQFGGILADDMGLGKTLQALSFIQKLKGGRKLNNSALIVAPTSVLWNWASEIERFTPNLKYVVFHGNDRYEALDQFDNADVVITSYALIQRDYDLYKDAEFTVVVLDEAQNIKNANAKRTRTVKSINSQMKLALTGTPLENHLGELWSIMDYALPGLLGAQDQFRQHFRTPIEKFGEQETNKLLCQKIAPFMLRRTKELVAKELPPKTEIIQEVHLAPDQRNLYEGVRISMEKKVRKLIQEKGAARSHIEFLDALLKLRQTCIAPKIVNLKQASKVKSSAKLEWLADTLPELVSEGKKVLIFSQFTKVLDLIQTLVEEARIPFVKLTGKTRHREKAIEQFQNTDTPIFLISLKAGGAGLNLTAADTVIHVDPWWNPAVENQATDRAYRIGQDKPVFVYKLVAKDTVEEKIQQMQKDKQALADKLFDASQKAKLPKSGDELLALLT